MAELKHFSSLVKPTVQTRFYIDFEWWKKNDRDWHVFLSGLLCPLHQEMFVDSGQGAMIDWVDAETAEVHQVDGIQHILITHCARQPDFITPHTTLVDSIFRMFLANGNVPITAAELGAKLDRSPEIILKTISGGRIYRGLRPSPMG